MMNHILKSELYLSEYLNFEAWRKPFDEMQFIQADRCDSKLTNQQPPGHHVYSFDRLMLDRWLYDWY